jgi:hypothetical protein
MPQIGAPRQPGDAQLGRTHASRTARNMSAPPNTTGQPPQFASFREFYPYYLAQHSNPTSRRLHIGGTLLALLIAAMALLRGAAAWVPLALLAGYLPAWIGHYFFEHNTPATFRHPLYSLRGDFTVLFEILTGRMRW